MIVDILEILGIIGAVLTIAVTWYALLSIAGDDEYENK